MLPVGGPHKLQRLQVVLSLSPTNDGFRIKLQNDDVNEVPHKTNTHLETMAVINWSIKRNENTDCRIGGVVPHYIRVAR